jgi:hypothetical protein
MAALRGEISFRYPGKDTHIPNIIDLSGKTKKLWSGQASLRRIRKSRRSGRKNQIKTICLSLRRGDIVITQWIKTDLGSIIISWG